MKIYYEAKALERAVDTAPRITPSTKSVLKKIIRSAPVADVAEVTCCKDCEHSYKGPVGLCCSYGACKDCLVPEYYFCFHGEKRRSSNDKT